MRTATIFQERHERFVGNSFYRFEMRVEIDLHRLKLLAHSAREIALLLHSEAEKVTQIEKKFNEHYKLILSFVELSEKQQGDKNET